MNKITYPQFIIALLFTLTLVLSACQNNQPVQFPQLIKVSVVDFYGNSGWDTISTDGKYYYSYLGAKLSIDHKNIISLDNYDDCKDTPRVKLSPNGRYLSSNSNAIGIVIYDIQERKCHQPQNADTYNAIESWSPESNRFVTAFNRVMMDYPSFNQVSYPSNYPIDFRKVKNIFGSSNILWDKDNNLPIAEVVTGCEGCISWDNPNFPNLQAKTYLEIRSLNVPALNDTTTPIRDRLLTFDWITGGYFPIFDPTGEYILIAIQEGTSPPPPPTSTKEMTPQQRYEYYYDSKYVKDTVLMLVHWRTKEYIELLHLSQYGQVQSNAILSEMSWSADGSTIFVPRRNAPPLVLKIKYP